MQTLKIIGIDNELGVILPEEMLSQLDVAEGQILYAVATGNGYLLTAADPSIDEQLAAGREFMHEYRETFEVLAK